MNKRIIQQRPTKSGVPTCPFGCFKPEQECTITLIQNMPKYCVHGWKYSGTNIEPIKTRVGQSSQFR